MVICVVREIVELEGGLGRIFYDFVKVYEILGDVVSFGLGLILILFLGGLAVYILFLPGIKRID